MSIDESERRTEQTSLRTEWWQEFIHQIDYKSGSEDSPYAGKLVIDPDRSLNALPKYDVSAACAIQERFAGEYRVIAGSGGQGVLIWDGRRWTDEKAVEIVASWVMEFWGEVELALCRLDAAIKILVQNEIEEARDAGLGKGEQQAAGERMRKHWEVKLRKHRAAYDRWGQDAGQKAVAHQVVVRIEQVVAASDVDASTGTLTVLNGVLDLSTAEASVREDRTREPVLELLPHSPDRLCTQLAPVVYRPEIGVGPRFAKYIADVLPDVHIRTFLQTATGMALIGQPRDKILINSVGVTNSGKSVIFNLISDVLGDYVVSIDAESLLQQRNGRSPSAASPDLHVMRSARIVTATEPDEGRAWSAGLLKRFTGNDPVPTRALYGQTISWIPRMLLLVASNAEVRLDVRDDALIQRLHLVRFNQQFYKPSPSRPLESIPVEQRADLSLTADILADEDERSGILNWMLDGLRRYLREGLIEPAGVDQARREMVENQSLARRWLAESVESGLIQVDSPGLQWQSIQIAEGFEMFRRWAEEQDEPERLITKNRFRGDLIDLGSSTPRRVKKSGTGGGRRSNGDCFDRWHWGNWRELWPEQVPESNTASEDDST